MCNLFFARAFLSLNVRCDSFWPFVNALIYKSRLITIPAPFLYVAFILNMVFMYGPTLASATHHLLPPFVFFRARLTLVLTNVRYILFVRTSECVHILFYCHSGSFLYFAWKLSHISYTPTFFRIFHASPRFIASRSESILSRSRLLLVV